MTSTLLYAALFAAASPADAPLVEGNPQSAVRAVVYEDLQCPDCAAFRKMLDEKLLPKYKGKVAFEHRDFPLAKHAWARKASVAARFFQRVKPELGLEFRRYMMADIDATTPENFAERVAAFATRNGVDAERAAAALDDPALAALVEKDFQDGVARGIARTPTVIVNGQPFIETFTFEEISKYIDEQLK